MAADSSTTSQALIAYNCGLPYNEFWGICITFFILSCSIMAFIIKSLIMAYRKKKTIKNFVFIIFSILFVGILVKIIYFGLEMGQDKVDLKIPDFFDDLRFFLIYMAYGCIIMYWASIYHNVFGMRNGDIFLPKAKIIFFTVCAIWFGLLVFDYVVDHNVQPYTADMDLAYYCLIIGSGYILSIGFLVYGGLIYHEIRKIKMDVNRKSRTRKLTIVVLVLSLTFILAASSLIGMIESGLFETCHGFAIGNSIGHAIELVFYTELIFAISSKSTTSSGSGSGTAGTTYPPGTSTGGQNSSGLSPRIEISEDMYREGRSINFDSSQEQTDNPTINHQNGDEV